jgi:hypothetical protein
VLASHPDSALHHFNSIVQTLARATTAADRHTVVQFAITTTSPDVTKLLTRHNDVVEWGSRAHTIDLFATDGLKPAHMLDAKKIIWGVSPGGTLQFAWSVPDAAIQVLDPFLGPGYQQLVYIAGTESDLPSVSELLVGDKEAANSLISEWLQTAQPPTTLMTGLVPLFDTAFVKHLLPAMAFFGLQSSEPWNTAMENYKAAVKTAVEGRIQAELSEKKNNAGDAEKKSMGALVERLMAVISGQLMSGHPFVPDVAGGVPLLCPAFSHALYKLFTVMSPALSLVKSPFHLTGPSC